MFRDAGYATGAIGKWGLGGPGTEGEPNEHGFDYFYGYMDQKQAHDYYPTQPVAQRTARGARQPVLQPTSEADRGS